MHNNLVNNFLEHAYFFKKVIVALVKTFLAFIELQCALPFSLATVKWVGKLRLTYRIQTVFAVVLVKNKAFN